MRDLAVLMLWLATTVLLVRSVSGELWKVSVASNDEVTIIRDGVEFYRGAPEPVQGDKNLLQLIEKDGVAIASYYRPNRRIHSNFSVFPDSFVSSRLNDLYVGVRSISPLVFQLNFIDPQPYVHYAAFSEGTELFTCNTVPYLLQSRDELICQGPSLSFKIVVTEGDALVDQLETNPPIRQLTTIESDAAISMLVSRIKQRKDVASSARQTRKDNEDRRKDARLVVVFLWILVGLGMLFLAIIAATWQSWVKPFFKKKAILKWTIILTVLVQAVSWSGGLIAWISAGVFLVLFSLGCTAALLFCRRKRIVAVGIHKSVTCVHDNSIMVDKKYYNRYPHKLSSHQRHILVRSTFAVMLTLVLFFSILYIWTVADYKVWDRIGQETIIEYQPQMIAKSTALAYSFDGLASLLHLGVLFDIQSNYCEEHFSKTLVSAEEKEEEILDAFISKYQIDMSIYERSSYIEYSSVNDWFTRGLANDVRPIAFRTNDSIIVSPADARVGVYERVQEEAKLWLKGDLLTMEELIADNKFYPLFKFGAAAIVRLAPQDYHRFHSPISGTIIGQYQVDGPLFSVNADAIRSENGAIYNKRTVTILEDPNGRRMGFIAIGATCVGSVVMTKTNGTSVVKGDEIGFFQFGGSTVVLVFSPNSIIFDDDVNLHSDETVEVLLRQGMTLAKWTS